MGFLLCGSEIFFFPINCVRNRTRPPPSEGALGNCTADQKNTDCKRLFHKKLCRFWAPFFWISRRWAGSEAAKSKKNKLTVKNALKNKLKGSAALLAKKCDDFCYAAPFFFQLINSENILDDFWYATQGIYFSN